MQSPPKICFDVQTKGNYNFCILSERKPFVNRFEVQSILRGLAYACKNGKRAPGSSRTPSV